MSLFKARDWWSTACGDEESFDQSSLCISSFNGNEEGPDSIIVGSHTGVVRIFRPSLESGSETSSYKPNDLLIEAQFPQPVLQLDVGRFISGSHQRHLAVLHPRSVAVYSLVTREGNTEHGEQSALVFIYEHQLRRSAYSFVAGPFGGVRGRDFLCVQALDGMLSFFEQETFVFNRQLPDFLLPGPFVFVPSTDAFVTCNSHYNVESYKYQVLSEAEEGKKNLVPEWSLNIGESVLDLSVVVHFANDVDILVLGEHNLFCVRDHGTLKFMRRFEFNPRCFYSYRTEPAGQLMVLVATDTGSLLILNNTTLKWSAQLSFAPIAISRATIQSMEGVLVLLSETGLLQCCYLGTEPSLFVAPAVEPRPIDYQEAEKELTQLNKMIRSFSDSSSMVLANSAAERELAISITSSQQPEIRGDCHVCHVVVELTPQGPLSKVQVTIDARPPLAVDPPTHTITSLCETYQVASYVSVSVEDQNVVWSLEVLVVVSYVTSANVPRVMHSVCNLPLRLVASPCAPVKEADVKITLNTNIPAVNLAELFPDFNGSSSGSQMLGFSVGSEIVTIIAAKMTTRYRLQCDSAIPLALFIAQLISRLERHTSRQGHLHPRIQDRQANRPGVKVTTSSAPPLPQLFTEIEKHFKCRRNIADLRDQLGLLCEQFRAIERRLLTKMKDKKPTVLGRLDTLLYSTQREITSISHHLEKEFKELHAAQCRTACALQLILLVVGLSDVSSNDVDSLRTTISPYFMDTEDQGWEDFTDASLQWLLRCSQPHSRHENLRQMSNVRESLTDISQLQSKISKAVNNVLKKPKEELEGRKPISPIPETLEVEELASEKPADSPAPAREQPSMIPSGSNNGSTAEPIEVPNTSPYFSKSVSHKDDTEDQEEILWI